MVSRTSPQLLHIILGKLPQDALMNNCTNLYYLSAIACKLSECLSETELSILAVDLTVLGDMLSAISTRQSACKEDSQI